MTKPYSEVMRELRKAMKARRRATEAELAALKRVRDELMKGKK